MKKLYITILIALSSMTTHAADYINRTITSIYVYDTDAIIVVNGIQANTDGCDPNKVNQVTISNIDTSNKSLYTASLVAAAGGNLVDIRTSGCGQWNVPKVYRIRPKF